MPGLITASLDAVARVLDAGGVAAIPTDTVWGIAARLDRPDAIAAIFAVKQRPPEVALPVLVASPAMTQSLVGDLDEVAVRLMARFWPGPLTVVVTCPPGLAMLTGATSTVGLRMPDDPRLLALLEATGPLATTSCNLHGQPPVISAEEAASLLGEGDVVLAGAAGGGRSSTVVQVLDGVVSVLRQGPIALGE